MDDQQQVKKHFDKMLTREVPSQIPVVVTKASYNHAFKHAKTEGGLWACRKNGARIRAKMVFMNVFNDDGSLNAANVPVATLYCSSCDKPPAVRGGDPVYARNIQTMSM